MAPTAIDDGVARDGLKPGDVVLITGAGGGFGRALARRFAGAGAIIVAFDKNAETLAETAGLVAAAGAVCLPLAVDLGDDSQIARGVETVQARFGGVYCLINNASVFPRATALDLPIDQWRKTLEVNLTAPFILSRSLAPAMIDAGRGVILNIASGRALQGAPEGASYAASKAALVNLTKTLALAWANRGVRVNAIVPGVSLTAQPLEGSTLEDLLARGPKKVPLGRIGMPEDVAGLALFLASADAAFMTGQAVAINGGQIMIP